MSAECPECVAWREGTSVATFTVTGGRWANLNGSHGNAHAHQALMNAWKALACVAIADAQCPSVVEPVTITATVRRTRNGRADAHNVTPTIKACIDAAVEMGLISDDSDAVVRSLTIQAGSKAKAPTVELEIRSAATAVAS